jgi:alanyl-tRNA synthetase
MKVKELKEEFIEFFRYRGHILVPSAGLVPTYA